MAAHRSPERDQAIAEGRSTYFTGKVCKHGHLSERNVVDSSCVRCRLIAKDARREKDKEYARRKREAMLATDPEGARRKWRETNRRLRRSKPEQYRKMDRKCGRDKRMNNPQRKLADVRARQTAKLLRTPKWADLKEIQKFYENCPEGYHVDHVLPLRGKKVSGLHVMENLQYLPAKENQIKGNTYHG